MDRSERLMDEVTSQGSGRRRWLSIITDRRPVGNTPALLPEYLTKRPGGAVASADVDAVGGGGIGGLVEADHRRAAVERPDVAAGAGAAAGHNVVQAVLVGVDAGDARPAEEGGLVGEKAQDRRVARPERLDVPARRPRPGAGDDLGIAVAVEVRRADGDAAAEALVGEERAHQRARGSAEHLDVGGQTRRADDHVEEAVAIDVAPGHVHAAEEAIEGEEAHHFRAVRAAEHLDVATRRPGARPDDDVADTVAVDVPDPDGHAAQEPWEGEEAA